jgi:hypothetical protein
MHGDPASHELWQQRATMALASAQRAGRTMTYAELADAATVPPPHRIHTLTLWLEDSMRTDAETGMPLRAALVISRNRNGLPAPGFFDLCRSLGLYDGPARGRNAATFHQDMLNRLFTA